MITNEDIKNSIDDIRRRRFLRYSVRYNYINRVAVSTYHTPLRIRIRTAIRRWALEKIQQSIAHILHK